MVRSTAWGNHPGDALTGVPGVETGAGVKKFKLSEAGSAEETRPVCRAFEPFVVKHYGVPVRGHMHIELDDVGTVLKGQPEGREGVLRCLGRAAAVCDHERPSGV